jgi:hypothetical protein
MTKVWKAAVLILLAVVAVALLLNLRSPSGASRLPSGPSTSTTAPEQPSNPVDLVTFYDHDATFDAPGCWQAVPRGLQTLANIPFRVGGVIQLWGEGPAGIGRNYRESVESIPATGKFQTLYVLHGASFTTVDGTPIADVAFRYSDGSSATNSILYGTDSRDWWQPMAEHNPLPANSQSKIIWRGDHPSLPDWVKTLRLFGTSIPNPKPESEVKCVDLVSTKSRVTWIVLALTTGPSGLLRMDPQMEQDESVPTEGTSMALTVLDKDTGQPVPDTRVQVILLIGRRPRSYGFFTTDEHGKAIVDLPPEHLKRLSIQTVANDYSDCEMSWNVLAGEKIPTNYVFKVAKMAR